MYKKINICVITTFLITAPLDFHSKSLNYSVWSKVTSIFSFLFV